MPTYTPELIMAACVIAVMVGTTCISAARFHVKKIIRSIRIYISDLLYRLGDQIHTLAYMIDTDW